MRKLFVKICYALAFSASALAFAFLGTGCGAEEPSGHQHSWTEAYDKTYHWWFCPDDNAIKDKSEHILDVEGECLLCAAFSGKTECVQYEEVGDYARVVGCEDTYDKVRILPMYNGLPVTEISENAFFGKCISSVVIPNSIVSIGKCAFKECQALCDLILPETLTTMGEDTFFGCTALTSICIPSKIKAIENETFKHCTSLTSVEISNGVTAIGEYAFENCAKLTTITISDSLTTIAQGAFEWCVGLTNVRIPAGVTSIGDRAFYGCSHLTTVELKEGIEVIGTLAFDCENLQYNVYGNAKYLGNETNPYLALITTTAQGDHSCEIHANTKVIADRALVNLLSVTRIEIPDGVTHIGAYAFQGRDNLTAVIIPKSVVYIGEKAFDLCEKVTFYCKAESQPSGWHANWNVLNREIVWNY